MRTRAHVPRVVVADDSPAMAEQLAALLTAAYDVVDIVPDGQALIDTVMRSPPDAIVSDIAMPVMNGLRAATAILSAHTDARIVLVTVLDSPSLIRRALAMGVCGYVLKCDAGAEIIGAVDAALHGSRYLSANARMVAVWLEGQGPSANDGT